MADAGDGAPDAGQRWAAGLSASPYWRRTMTDEAWREVKAAWNTEVERDVA